jgi:hypothetical protein
MGKALKNTVLTMSLLALIAGGINGYNAYKNWKDRQNINHLVNNLVSFHKNKDENTLKSIQSLDEKIDSVNLDRSMYETYLDFKDMGYIYCKSEAEPIILKIEKQDKNVYFCRQKTKDFEGISDRKKSSFTIGSWDDIIINLDSMEKAAENVEKGWKDIEMNNSYFKNNDKRWVPYLQAFYNLLKNEPDKKDAYKRIAIESSIIHENQHIGDRFSDYSRTDEEARAYLKELMHSPKAFSTMGSVIYDKNPGEYHKKAAIKVMNGFLSFKDIKSERDIYRLSDNKIAEKAKILFDRFYPE